MVSGIRIGALTGRDGTVDVPGMGGMILATFQSWALERREETPDGTARWFLRGVFSYHNDALLRNEGLPLRIRIKIDRGSEKELLFDRKNMTLHPNHVTIKEVILR